LLALRDAIKPGIGCKKRFDGVLLRKGTKQNGRRKINKLEDEH